MLGTKNVGLISRQVIHIMKRVNILQLVFPLVVIIFFSGCSAPFSPMQPFPNHIGAMCIQIYEPPPMLSVTNINCPDKAITSDFQSYIQSNNLIDSIILIHFYDDKTGWRAIQITELKKPAEQRLCIEHLLEYDKSGVRIKTSKVSWRWHSF